MDGKTDMIMSGGRHPMKITYSVGFRSAGKITALKLDILIDSGMYIDVSPILPDHILGSLKKYDRGALSFDIKLCKTNLPSRAAMRAPGEVQGSYIAEVVIELIASTLSMDVDSVRNINLHTHNSIDLFFASAPENHQSILYLRYGTSWPLLRAFTTGPKWLKSSIGAINGRKEVFQGCLLSTK